MRFRSLGSGSAGNATLIEAGGLAPLRLLVDCGLGMRQLQLRLEEDGLQPGDIDAIFITHEHGDHIGCAHPLSLRHGIPVWMSRGTHAAIGSPDFRGLLRIARDGCAIDLGALQITPFTVPHDAREPLQLCCTDGQTKLGMLTDLGHATDHVLTHLQNCHALVLECNHDPELLALSSYPEFLKRRVGGQYGHLSNAAAAHVLRSVRHVGLRHLVAAHLSLQNNRAELVRMLLSQILDEAPACNLCEVSVAQQGSGTRWLTV